MEGWQDGRNEVVERDEERKRERFIDFHNDLSMILLFCMNKQSKPPSPYSSSS
jgi:hypothetical protein